MRGFAAVLGRELFERRLLGVMALLLGLFPVAAVRLPGFATESPAQVRNGVACGLALTLSAVLAILLGGSVLSRDLGEGRLGFYFSRPLPGWAIWAGKLAAVLVLSLGSALLIALPAALLNGHLPNLESGAVTVDPRATWALLALCAVALALLSHACGVILRARTAWLGLDFAGALAFALLAWSASRRLGLAGAFASRWQMTLILSGVALVGLLAAGAGQVMAGRTDPRRAHRALSLTLWAVLLAGALGAQGFTRWALAGTPGGLEVHSAAPSPGSWIEVEGVDRRRQDRAAFLVDRESGRFLRLPYPWRGVKFSGNGHWAVWPEPAEERPEGPAQLSRLELGRPGAAPFRSNVVYARMPEIWALSPDGSRVAAILDGRVVVDEIATGRRLAAAPLPTVQPKGLRFVGPALLQLRGPERPALQPGDVQETWRVWGMDVARGTLWSAGRFADPFFDWSSWSPDGSRALQFDPKGRLLELLDGWTGRPLAHIPWDGGDPLGAYFLADGRIAALAPGEGWREVRVFSPDLSAELLRRRVQGRGRPIIAAQPTPGLAVLEIVPSRQRLLLLDLATGATRPLRADLVPLGGRLFLTPGGRLVELDPETAALRPVPLEKEES
jgi:hypothetical protein